MESDFIKINKIENRENEKSIYRLLSGVESFEIEFILIEYWIVNDKLLSALLKIKFNNKLWFKYWIFWQKDYKMISISDKKTKQKEIIFYNCKYTEMNWKELDEDKCRVIRNDKFVKFIVIYLNIKDLMKYMKWIVFKSSFGVDYCKYSHKKLKNIIEEN